MGEITKVRSVDGVEIVAEIEGNGPPLVLLHGITEDRSSWSPFVSHLGNVFTLVRIDFRGHGESQSVDNATLEQLVTDVVQVVNELSLVKPAYIGHSLGGVVATFISAAHGANRVVCVDQRLSVQAFHQLLKNMKERLHGEDFPEALIEEGNALGLQRVPPQLRSTLEVQRRQANQNLVLSLWSKLFTQNADSIDEERAAVISHVKTPYLALHGEALDQNYLSWVKGLIPHAEIEWWPDSGHWLHYVEPQRFLDKVVPFLTGK